MELAGCLQPAWMPRTVTFVSIVSLRVDVVSTARPAPPPKGAKEAPGSLAKYSVLVLPVDTGQLTGS